MLAFGALWLAVISRNKRVFRKMTDDSIGNFEIWKRRCKINIEILLSGVNGLCVEIIVNIRSSKHAPVGFSCGRDVPRHIPGRYWTFFRSVVLPTLSSHNPVERFCIGTFGDSFFVHNNERPR